jgi:hypothetical protein
VPVVPVRMQEAWLLFGCDVPAYLTGSLGSRPASSRSAAV